MKKKRILSIILAIAMLACMIPMGMVTVSAESYTIPVNSCCLQIDCYLYNVTNYMNYSSIYLLTQSDFQSWQENDNTLKGLADACFVSGSGCDFGSGNVYLKFQNGAASFGSFTKLPYDSSQQNFVWPCDPYVDSDYTVVLSSGNDYFAITRQDYFVKNSNSFHPVCETNSTTPTEFSTHTHTAGTEWMTDGRAHWLKCAGDDCDLETVEDYEIAFSSYYGDELKTTLSHSEETEIGLMMGRQGKIEDGNVSTEIGRTIIPLTQTQLDNIGNTLVIVGCDDSDDNKPVYASIDCAYTYFYNGETKIEAAGMKNAQGEDVAAFVILDNDGLSGTITGYGYYRIYSDSVDGTFIGDILFKAPRTFKAVYDTTDDANTLNYYFDNKDHSGEGKTVYENTAEKLGLFDNSKTTTSRWGYSANLSKIKTVEISPSVIKYSGLTDTGYMFSNMMNAGSIKGAEYLDVSNVTDMTNMFNNFARNSTAINAVPDVSDWNTGNVTSLKNMFAYYAYSSTVFNAVPDVSGWNTGNVESMNSMFSNYAYKSTVFNAVPDVSDWNTCRVKDLTYMFASYAYSSTVFNAVPDVSDWNTGNVTKLNNMFASYAYSSTAINAVPDVSEWNTGNVTSLDNMFQRYAYTSTEFNAVPDISKWNTGNVTSLSCMFQFYANNSVKLNFTLNLSEWDVSKCTGSIGSAFSTGDKVLSWEVIIPIRTNGLSTNNTTARWYTTGLKYIMPATGKSFTLLDTYDMDSDKYGKTDADAKDTQNYGDLEWNLN